MNNTPKTVFTEKLNPELSGNVIIYGAGYNCTKMLINLIREGNIKELNILCLIDADKSIQGSSVCGYFISSPDDLQQFDKSTPVIITPTKCAGIKAYLNKLGFKNLYYYSAAKYNQLESLVSMLQSPTIFEGLIERNKEKINFVRSKLADDKSVKVLDAYISSRLTNDFSAIEELIERPVYYPDGIISINQSGEVFVDCGAYGGESAYEFSNRCPNYVCIYSFEPDPMQFELTKKYITMQKIERCELYNMGVFSGEGEIKFYLAPGGSSSFLVGREDEFENKYKQILTPKEVIVKTVSLDKVLYGKPVPTFIKMDIEGAELEALKGAVGIIGANYPKLAICLYHNTDDIWEIPYYVATTFPQYALHIRQHDLTTDTVLYAVRKK